MRIVYTERHMLHSTHEVHMDGHPFVTEEVPARAEIIRDAALKARLGSVNPPSDHGLEPILAVHDRGYISFLTSVYAEHAAFFGQAAPVFAWTFATRHSGRKPQGFLGLLGYYACGSGTPVLEGTWEAAYWSAQCALTAADLVRAGERAAYALCRPPGHHAGPDLYGGFCYLNNAAVAARNLQEQGVKVAILDVDYHHGNGTQAAFYSDPEVLFCSLHAHPDSDFPYYWGEADERGAGAGEGFNYNWPLSADTDDATYLTTLDAALAVISEFHPRYLVVSAGFDIVTSDPVGSFRITRDGLCEIASHIAELALPTVIVQEGGYALSTLGQNAVAFLQPFAKMS